MFHPFSLHTAIVLKKLCYLDYTKKYFGLQTEFRNNVFLFFSFLLHWVFVSACGLFSSCGERGLLFLVVLGLLTVGAFLAVEQRL